MNTHRFKRRVAQRFAVMAAIVGGLPIVSKSQAPSITRFEIANGSFNTEGQTVYLNITTQGPMPTAFRASERSDMSGALWRQFVRSPQFTLSSGQGGKTVYVQVGMSPPLTSTSGRTPQAGVSLPADMVPAPRVVSTIVSDAIVLGLPDIQSEVDMPRTVRDGHSFDFWITISNKGQINPKEEIIQVYNSFVTNTISIDRVEVNFLGKLTGKGCVVTAVSTAECSLAQMDHNGGAGIHLFATVTNGVPAGQITVAHTLRTRLTGVRESQSALANNWRDTPITIVK